MSDYYDILGVSKNATQEEIKKAFHKMAHKYHPDKGGGDEKKFKEINEAYQVLANQEKRAQYDRFGRTFDEAQGQGGFAGQDGFSWFWGNRPGADVEFDFSDLGGLGDLFEDFFGFNDNVRGKKKDIKKGTDIRVEIEISLEETLKETKKIISLRKQVLCSRCNGIGAEPGTKINECFSCRGTGQVQQVKRTFLGSVSRWTTCPECGGEGQRPEKPCNVCKGEGRIKGEEDIEIFIPAGIDSNQIIKVSGKGNAGRRGGKAGDLYVRISVKEHPVFERKGDDLYTALNINLSQSVLGADVELQTLDGSASLPQDKTKILLEIPAGTESGKTVKISSKGIPHFSGRGRGDLYIKLIIKTPKKLTKKQKELFEKLKEEGI